jgi:hypothetical protein
MDRDQGPAADKAPDVVVGETKGVQLTTCHYARLMVEQLSQVMHAANAPARLWPSPAWFVALWTVTVSSIGVTG